MTNINDLPQDDQISIVINQLRLTMIEFGVHDQSVSDWMNSLPEMQRAAILVHAYETVGLDY